MELGDAADGPNGPTEPTYRLADGADADHPDDDGEETFKSAAYFPSLMIHRRLEELDGVQHWIRCEGRDHGHQIDSRVHYFDREIGFLQAEADQEMIERNKATAAAFARRRQQVEKRKAHHKTVDRWSMFERWVLDRMPAEQYAQFCSDPRTHPRVDWLSASRLGWSLACHPLSLACVAGCGWSTTCTTRATGGATGG